MRYLLACIFVTFPLYADMITVKSLACPSSDSVKKSVLEDLSDPLKLEMYAIANDCVVVSRGDSVSALGYDPASSKETFVKIFHKKSERELFMLRSALQIEQAGKKNRLRF